MLRKKLILLQIENEFYLQVPVEIEIGNYDYRDWETDRKSVV